VSEPIARSELSGIVVPAADLSASLSFYATYFGLQPRFVDGERWATLANEGSALSLGAGDQAPASGHPQLMFKTDDIERARRVLGDRAESGIIEGPHERLLRVTDPGGASIVIYVRK
jgi:predicted enzyme related to lactoylglutathione lyase